MIRAAILAAVAALAQPAHAADLCHDRAALYQLAHALRSLPDRVALAQLGSSDEARVALDRVRPAGDLGFLSAGALYRHVYLECRSAASE